MLLGDRDPGPAELTEFLPQRLVGRSGLGVLPNPLGAGALGGVSQGPPSRIVDMEAESGSRVDA